jgi:mannose-6-phosphate isomerase-like protein (cupin superfamily)
MSTAIVTNVETLRQSHTAGLFQGAEHGGVAVSFFVVHQPPGGGPSLHVHPYEEVFVVHEGEAAFTIGGESMRAVGGDIVVAPREVPHKFTNCGRVPLRMTNIHPSPRVVQEWLE